MYARDFPDHTNIYWPTDIAIWKLCPSLHCCLKIDPPTLRTELILKPLHQGTGMKRLLAFSVTRTYSLVGNVNWNLMESTDFFFFFFLCPSWTTNFSFGRSERHSFWETKKENEDDNWGMRESKAICLGLWHMSSLWCNLHL